MIYLLGITLQMACHQKPSVMEWSLRVSRDGLAPHFTGGHTKSLRDDVTHPPGVTTEERGPDERSQMPKALLFCHSPCTAASPGGWARSIGKGALCP